MWLGIGQVKEKGFCLMVVDELNGAFGQSGRHLIDRRIVLYHVIIVIEWQCWIGMVGRWMIGPHIVGVGKTVKLGKTMTQWQVFGLITQMPLPIRAVA